MMNRHYLTTIGLLAMMAPTGCATISDSCFQADQPTRHCEHAARDSRSVAITGPDVGIAGPDAAIAGPDAAIVGLSASEKMIETIPNEQPYLGEMIHEGEIIEFIPDEEYGVQSSSNRDVPNIPNLDARDESERVTAPNNAEREMKAEEMKRPIVEPKQQADFQPQVQASEKPNVISDVNSDASTFYPTANKLPVISFSELVRENRSNAFTDAFTLSPIIPTAVPAVVDGVASTPAQSVGFIRLAEPTQDATSIGGGSGGQAPNRVNPVAIVEAARTPVELRQSDSTTRPAQ